MNGYNFSYNNCSSFGEDLESPAKSEEDLPSFKSCWCQVCFTTLTKWGTQYNKTWGNKSAAWSLSYKLWNHRLDRPTPYIDILGMHILESTSVTKSGKNIMR